MQSEVNMSAILCHMVNGVSVQSYHIKDDSICIGRSINCDIFIEEKAVSSEHAEIQKIQNNDASHSYIINDLKSTNNTFVNNLPVESKILENNDLIRIGFTTLKFVNDSSVDLTQTVRIKKSWIPGVYYTSDD